MDDQLAANNVEMQILLLPPPQGQELVSVSVDGQLVNGIVLENGFRTPTEVGKARAVSGHLITNTAPVKFITEDQKLRPGLIQSLPEGPKEHYAAVSGLR